MHILEIPSFFPPYGGLFCLDQSKALAALGHDVRIIANVQLSVRRSVADFLSARTSISEQTMDGITVWRKEMRGLPRSVRFNVRHWVNNVRTMFARYVKTYGVPDIIHAHCAKWAGYAAMLIARDYNLPYVITEHLSSMLYLQEFGPPRTDNTAVGLWQVPLLRRALKEAAMVVPVSAELVDDLAPYFGRDYQFTPLSNIIDTEFFACRQPDGKHGHLFTFCALAINIPLKAYDILIPAFLIFAARHPASQLLIAGRDTEKLNVRELAKSLLIDGNGSDTAVGMFLTDHPDGNIHIFGEVDKYGVRDILYQSDCLVLASRCEAQGLVLLEAMSTGIRTITTEAAPRNVRIEGGCTVVPVDDVTALAEAMEAVYATPFSGGEALSERVSAVCSPRAVGLKLEKILTDAQRR